MRNALAAAALLLFGPGLADPAGATLHGQLKPVAKSKHKVVCKDLKQCNDQDYEYFELDEEELDAVETRIDKAIAAREAMLRRKLTEAERDAVVRRVIQAEFNQRVAALEKNSGRRLTSSERRVLFEEFLETTLEKSGLASKN